MPIKLDRIALDDVGANPEQIAQAIHAQIGERAGAVDVHEIAYALDIKEIREAPLKTIEGALITTAERSYGSILVNDCSSPQRRRFTVGHELGHFLNPWHRPTSQDGFRCSRSDMSVAAVKDQNRHMRQEAEANTFSIELLAPQKRVEQFLGDDADLERVLALAIEFDISKEAAARRYIALHQETLAVVFSKDSRFSYVVRANGFPWLYLRKGSPMPFLPPPNGNGSLSAIEVADPEDWLEQPNVTSLTVQTLHQQDGYALTLLWAETADEDDLDAIDDSTEPLPSFGRRS